LLICQQRFYSTFFNVFLFFPKKRVFNIFILIVNVFFLHLYALHHFALLIDLIFLLPDRLHLYPSTKALALWNDTPPAVRSMILQGISPASLRGLKTFPFMGLSRWDRLWKTSCEKHFTNDHITQHKITIVQH